jgi:hypothetical protein
MCCAIGPRVGESGKCDIRLDIEFLRYEET